MPGKKQVTRRAALGLMAGGGLLAATETLGFSNVTAGRGVSVSTASDPNALIGLTVSDPVQKNNREPLVDIENNTTETIAVTVSLDDCTQGTLYDSDGSGCSVSLSIAPGVIKTVDIQADVAEIIPFTISANSSELSFEATRETTAETGDTGGPTAEAGGPYSVDETNSRELDGTGSSGSNLSYSWTITDGGGSLDDATTATPVYNAPSVQSDTTVTVELTVTDSQGASDTDTASITVSDVGSPPSVDSLTVTKTGSDARTFAIDADVSDQDGNLDRVEIAVVGTKNGKTEYSNTLSVSGSSDSISDTTTQLGNRKEYRIEVTVYDTSGASDTETRTRTTG